MASLHSTAFGAETQQLALPPGLSGHVEEAVARRTPLDAAGYPPGFTLAPWDDPLTPEPGVPLRCRLGFHRWLPLALSVHGAGAGAGAGLSVSFCRCCPAVRRPAALGAPQRNISGRP